MSQQELSKNESLRYVFYGRIVLYDETHLLDLVAILYLILRNVHSCLANSKLCNPSWMRFLIKKVIILMINVNPSSTDMGSPKGAVIINPINCGLPYVADDGAQRLAR